jgi:hypothetical protein
MGVPATVTIGFEVLRSVKSGDMPAALARATKAGKKRLAAALATPRDERAVAMVRWSGSAKGRVDTASGRGMCRFAELDGGRVAVFDLVIDGGRYLVDDVRILSGGDFESFGVVDDFAAKNAF